MHFSKKYLREAIDPSPLVAPRRPTVQSGSGGHCGPSRPITPHAPCIPSNKWVKQRPVKLQPIAREKREAEGDAKEDGGEGSGALTQEGEEGKRPCKVAQWDTYLVSLLSQSTAEWIVKSTPGETSPRPRPTGVLPGEASPPTSRESSQASHPHPPHGSPPRRVIPTPRESSQERHPHPPHGSPPRVVHSTHPTGVIPTPQESSQASHPHLTGVLPGDSSPPTPRESSPPHGSPPYLRVLLSTAEQRSFTAQSELRLFLILIIIISLFSHMEYGKTKK